MAEVKRASPSAGPLQPGLDPEGLAAAYARGGAAALSVLTEPDFFSARPDDLARARRASGLPTLRKDFVVDPWQVAETALLGADAVLLLVVVLGRDTGAHVDLALDLGITPFVEVHTAEEMEIALGTRAAAIGINNRDLRTFALDPGTAARLAPRAAGRTVAALSGIRTPEDLRGLAAAGVSAVLVGESLVRATDPERAVRALVEAAA
jgi:indole-3-glycerol phosphate synthase